MGQSAAFTEGHEAYLSNTAREANPYASAGRNSAEFKEWDKGWEDGEEWLRRRQQDDWDESQRLALERKQQEEYWEQVNDDYLDD